MFFAGSSANLVTLCPHFLFGIQLPQSLCFTLAKIPHQMRPKNRVFCPQCNRPKLLFTSREKAYTFIRFNAQDITAQSGHAPNRAYFCQGCGGWHVTSKPKQ